MSIAVTNIDHPLTVRLVHLPTTYPQLNQVDTLLDPAATLLDEEERRRLAALVHQADRDQFAAAHIGLRLLLADHFGEHPASLVFDRAPCPLCGEPHGRPLLAGEDGFHFSLSRRPGIAAYALAAAPVGIDIETLSRQIGLDDLTAALHPAEQRSLATLPPSARRHAALRGWVRKEAYLKARGTGLGLDPGEVEVGVAEQSEPRELPDGWMLADLPAPNGHLAALAVAQ